MAEALLKAKFLVGEDTPVLLTTVGTISLPVVVESGEKNDRVTADRFNGGDSGLLVFLGSNSLAQGLTNGWPARFSDQNVFVTLASTPDSLDLFHDPGTGVFSGGVVVKVGVGVDGHEVGVVTQAWVVNDSDESVDRHDWTIVACGGQMSSTLLDVRANLGNGGLTAVNQLVTDGNSVDVVPGTVRVDGILDGVNTVLDSVDVIDTQEQLLVGGLALQDSANLVTVDTVQSDDVETGQLAQLRSDLGRALTGAGVAVRRVGDTLGTTGAHGARGGRRGLRARRASGARGGSRARGGGRARGSSRAGRNRSA